MIFVTQNNTSTMVKCVPQEKMVHIRRYAPTELFAPFSKVCHNVVVSCSRQGMLT